MNLDLVSAAHVAGAGDARLPGLAGGLQAGHQALLHRQAGK